ncbi:hypothetical protein QQX98_002817 [Neonectria punicea]|uniref:Uncharacterized protein n=1 Tax=Neonectria punicea TaxID=979145 RepID=A0ABR1HHS7_9HYPO
MESIGRITAAAASASLQNELTLAAAAFNIDFSLIKVQAPKEYDGVKNSLTAFRRNAAEGGQPHIVARRLGALFEPLVPPISHLIRVYGIRASEISLAVQEHGDEIPNLGLFSDCGGLDGTNIWAAATSGRGAFAVHFLACLLARIWKSPEAISIWVQIVEQRKQESVQNYNEANDAGISSLNASQQLFTRHELAAWDSSARSWLQTADATKRLQHTQLTLIINNLRMPVNSNPDPYQSVLKAWISAMTAMDRLAQRIPQRVQDGAVLLAMSSWHLYPDMEVLVGDCKTIHQSDTLMEGAIITLSTHGVGDGEEVFWSLPLSRMRYYSTPVAAEARLASDTSRVSMQEFHVVILGMVIAPWTPRTENIPQSCRLVQVVNKRLEENPTKVPWVRMLANAAQLYSEANGVERHHLGKLLGLGMRRSVTDHLGDPLEPGFGLRNFRALFSMLKDTEACIQVCREIATKLQSDGNGLRMMIRYKLQARPSTVSAENLAYASVSAPSGILKRARSGVHIQTPKLCRFAPAWIPMLQQQGEQSQSTDCDNGPGQPRCLSFQRCIGCRNHTELRALQVTGEEFQFVGIKDSQPQRFTMIHDSKTTVTYDYVLGDIATVALFQEHRVSH